MKEISAYNKVYSASLSELLSVSEDTIRRDLHELAEIGKLKKVHGGAMANPHLPDINANHSIANEVERRKIAQKACDFIENNQVLLLEGDSTNMFLVDLIPKSLNITVYTNSLPLALKLHKHTNIETIVLGGRLSHKHKTTVGMDVMRALDEIHADLCFMETATLHEEIGITDRDRENAFAKKVMFSASSRIISLCLSDDLGVIQPFKVESISMLHAIITELEPEDYQLTRFKNKGVTII